MATKRTMPAQFTTNHKTDGLPGWGAWDWSAPAGTVVGSPVSGTIVRLSGDGKRHGTVYGWNIYIKTDDGRMLFLTHFSTRMVKKGQRIGVGTPLGRVMSYGKASHIHIAVQGAADKGEQVDLSASGAQGQTGGNQNQTDGTQGTGFDPSTIPPINVNAPSYATSSGPPGFANPSPPPEPPLVQTWRALSQLPDVSPETQRMTSLVTTAFGDPGAQ